jgi:hypothetical protein
MLVTYLFLPLGFAPAIGIFLSEDAPIWLEQPVYIIGYFGLFFVLSIATFFIGALVQAAISCGVLRAERTGERTMFNDVLKASYPFLGRFLGIMFLYMGGIFLVILAYSALQILVSMLTLGFGAICIAPLQLLLYPLMFVTYAWLELAQASIIVDGSGVFEAARRGWQVFRQNLISILLMTLIMYLGVGMLSGFISVPLMLPLFAAFFGLIESIETGRTVFVVSALCMIVYLPLLAVFQSVALTFMKSGWLFTYLRLTRNAETAVVVLPAT